jgi:hypothetical protein
MSKLRLIIAGSRDITDYEALRAALVASRLWKKHKHNIEVVSGAARGVDTLGEIFADRNGLKVHSHPADWDSYGKRAGYIRNAEMADNADALLLLWDGKSKGSQHMYDIAKSKGLEIHAFIYCGRDPACPELPLLKRIVEKEK